MSWQSYVDQNLLGSGQLRRAAIIGLGEGQTLADSGDFLKDLEGKNVVALFRSPNDVFATGVTVGGVKYIGVKADDRSIHGKKGATGVALARTGETIVIGYYDEQQQPGNAALIVEQLATHLVESGS